MPRRLRPLNKPRELGKALGLEPSALLRATGWTKERGRFHLRVSPAESARLRVPAGLYRSRSVGGCMVPAVAASALSSSRGVEWCLIDPDVVAARAIAAAGSSAGGPCGGTAVVAVLAHVDHGKTTLLDALLGTSVAAHEPGRITQSVRPSILRVPLGLRRDPTDPSALAFLDTPGHAVFGGMRAAAEQSADVRLVLVAVDAGVQAQTREVLRRCARARGPTLLALTKLDTAWGAPASLDEARQSGTIASAAAGLRRVWAEEVAQAEAEHAAAGVGCSALPGAAGAATAGLPATAGAAGGLPVVSGASRWTPAVTRAQEAEVALLCAPRGWGLEALLERLLAALRSAHAHPAAPDALASGSALPSGHTKPGSGGDTGIEPTEAPAVSSGQDGPALASRGGSGAQGAAGRGGATRGGSDPLETFPVPACVANVVEVVQMRGHGAGYAQDGMPPEPHPATIPSTLCGLGLFTARTEGARRRPTPEGLGKGALLRCLAPKPSPRIPWLCLCAYVCSLLSDASRLFVGPHSPSIPHLPALHTHTHEFLTGTAPMPPRPPCSPL
jgi:small GTP-binding protein